MSLYYIMAFSDFFGFLLGFAALIIAIIYCNVPRMKFFFALSLTTAVVGLSNFLALFAQSDDAIIITYKLAYWGIPLTGILTLLFGIDYSEKKQPPLWLRVVMISGGLFITMCVQAYPFVRLVHSEIKLFDTGSWSYGVSTPGPLYYFVMAYSEILCVAGVVLLTKSVWHKVGKINGVIMGVTASMPIISLILLLTGVTRGWDLVPATQNLVLFIWCLNTVYFKTHEWLLLGRDNALQNMRDGYILVSSDGKLIDVNACAYSYFPELKTLEIGSVISENADIPHQLFNSETRVISKINENGVKRHFSLSHTPVHFKKRTIAYSTLIIDDTEIYNLIDKLEHLSRQDPLTGLNNRTAFFNDVVRDFALIQRSGQPGALMMLDIDNFKNVNDNYGHAAGDVVLRSVADQIVRRLRSTDIVGRYGGEEFCAWLPNALPEGAESAAESIRQSIESQTFMIDDETPLNVTISIGVSNINLLAPSEIETLDRVLKRADDNLYKAKTSGRNKIVTDQYDVIGEVSKSSELSVF